MVDGGIRRGTDVIKALALGAHFVFVGRPFLYAAVAGGQAGVERAITLLQEEIGRDLALLGIRSHRRDHAGSGAEVLRQAFSARRLSYLRSEDAVFRAALSPRSAATGSPAVAGMTR